MGTQVGVCCYNRRAPENYHGTEVDPVFCKPCLTQELNGQHSYRQGANDKFGVEHDHSDPIVLDLTPNKNCNLACKICSEDHSSTWANIKGIPIKRNYNLSVPALHKILLSKELKHVKEINFSGGEPWSNSNIVKYVEPLKEKIDFSKVVLRFSTNGSYKFNSKLNNFFQQFKLVLANFSLDDIEAAHEYQRWPSKWDQWQQNWQYFLEHLPHNVMPAINRTVSILNIHRLQYLEQWHQQYQVTRHGDPINLIDHFALGDYSLDFLPPNLKVLAMQQGGSSQRNVINMPVATVDKVQYLQNNIVKRDQLQGTDLAQCDPDLYRAIFK
jgi:organic radical activating enzyme